MKHIFPAAVVLTALAAGTASCSLFTPKGVNATRGDAASVVETPAQVATPTNTTTTPAPAPVQAQPVTIVDTPVSEAAEAPEPAAPVATTPAAAAAAAAQVAQSEPGPVVDTDPVTEAAPTALAASIAGEWNIIQVGTTTVDRDEDMPYLTFEPSTGRFYANDGCNIINGSYRLNGNDDVEFFGVLSTMKYCPDAEFASAIGAVINENRPAHLVMTKLGTETYIDFTSLTDGKSLMRMRRGNLEFLNGNWKVESIAGIDKLEVPADIFIDLSELKVHGNTGCNYFNGTIYLDHRASNAIDFSNMALTRMACPYTAQETAMMVALEEATTAIQGGHDKVMLLDSRGRDLMTLSRLPLNANADEE